MNFQAIMELLIGLSFNAMPVYLQPVAYLLTMIMAFLFFMLLVRLILVPFSVFFGR